MDRGPVTPPPHPESERFLDATLCKVAKEIGSRILDDEVVEIVRHIVLTELRSACLELGIDYRRYDVTRTYAMMFCA
mgnify:FL=1